MGQDARDTAAGTGTLKSADAPDTPLLQVEGLRVEFGSGKDRVQAVRDVGFRIARNSTLALVGESGSGKTTVGRAIIRLLKPAAGRIIFDGTDLTAFTGLGESGFRPFRKRIQMIFQDPYSSLDPRLSIRGSLKEALQLGFPSRKAEWEDILAEKMRLVGLAPDYLSRYPHEFSGGQRQRIGIARALCVEPEFLICDEPVSSLDVSIQAQILNLLMDLQERLGLAYLFISHDLRVVKHIAREVAVMQRGEIVEMKETEELYRAPAHAYTRTLLEAIPGR
ncbi:MAG: oligopeptide/dipeptide transporter, ATPase subunit [Fibrobacteres bacterium]|nr:oligopeptide/dipeptide transporter, ATPase subunit [Fibrobacterota bacterium]